MRTIISSLIGAALLAAFAAVGSGLISGVYEQTKAPIAAAERAAEARQLLEIFPALTHDNQLIDDTFNLDAVQGHIWSKGLGEARGDDANFFPCV